MLSGSWKTGLVGYGLIALDIIAFIVDCISQQGFPKTKEEWFAFAAVFIAGLNGVLSKDHDKTNSKDPAAAITVPTAAAATTNPAAPK